MKLRTLALSVALLGGLFSPIAQAETVYVRGVVAAVDAEGGTFTIQGETYAVDVPALLADALPGSEVVVAYVNVDGKRTAISIVVIAGDAVDAIAVAAVAAEIKGGMVE